jgi:hypothetical protein
MAPVGTEINDLNFRSVDCLVIFCARHLSLLLRFCLTFQRGNLLLNFNYSANEFRLPIPLRDGVTLCAGDGEENFEVQEA